MDAQPWQCPACKTWIRADITEHRCDGGAGVTAKLPGPHRRPPTVASATITTAHWYPQVPTTTVTLIPEPITAGHGDQVTAPGAG